MVDKVSNYREVRLSIFVGPAKPGGGHLPHRASLFARVVKQGRQSDRLLARGIDCGEGEMSDLAGIISALECAVQALDEGRYTPPR